MFTKRVFRLPVWVEDSADVRALGRALKEFFGGLENPGQIAIAEGSGSFNTLSSQIAPTGNNLIPAGYCSYVVDSYTVAANQYLEIGAGASLEIG